MPPKRVPKATGLPPATEDPGPVEPVDLQNVTDASAYYNTAIAAGEIPERAAYKPGAGGEPKPDIVIAFNEAAHQRQASDFSGDDLTTISDFYESQINTLYRNQMDALANQNKETLAHANTRDAFAIVYAQLEKALKDKQKAEEEKAALEAEREVEKVATKEQIEAQDQRLASLNTELEEQKQQLTTKTDENENTKQAFAVLIKNWTTQCEEMRERIKTIDTLNEELAAARSSAGGGEELQQLHNQLATAREESNAKDSTIASLNEELVEQKQLVLTNQNSFANVFRAGDHRTKLQNDLARERERVAELTTQLTETQTQLRESEASRGQIDDAHSFVTGLLAQHAQTTGPKSPNSAREARNALRIEHAEFMGKTKTATASRIKTGRAVALLVQAQLAIRRKHYTEAFDFLRQAKAENNDRVPPDQADLRVEGRISYWRGRAEFLSDDYTLAVEALERAHELERRGSFMGTLYDIRRSAPDLRADEDDVARPNFLLRGKQLDVSGLLDRAKQKKSEQDEQAGFGA